ncbi:MAG: alpha/beta hydrolase [Terracidiphilus sp.]
MEGARRLLIYVVLVIAAMFIGLFALIFFSQRSLIYFPQPRSNSAGLIMSLPSIAGPVLVSMRPASGPDAIVYFGGNAEDVSLDLPDFATAFPNDAIYLLHYPGYGGSAGHPTEKSILAAAFVLFDAVHAQHANVTLIGRSLGTGVAIHVASQRPVARIVLVTPYDSLVDVAQEHYPFLPNRWMMLDKYDSWKYAPQVTAPTKIIAAGNDEVIPRTSTERLRTRFRDGIVSYVVVPGVGHNSISESPDYLRLLGDQ